MTQIWAFGLFFYPLQPPWGRGWGSQTFSTGPQLSEYVQVVCRNTNGTCLKSVSKTPTSRFFRDFQQFQQDNPAKWPILEVFGQNEQNEIFSKKHFSRLQALINCKDSEKVLKGFREKCKKPPFLGILAQNG